MKRIMFIISFIVLVFTSCSNMQVGFEKDSPFYGGGVVYIYLGDVKSIDKYRVYINNEDTSVDLCANTKTRFGIVEGQTNIQVVKGRETASIDIFLNKSNEYYLKVITNEKNTIMLVQVPKSSINTNVKITPLYMSEKAKKASTEADATAIKTDYDEDSNVSKFTKTPANGDTIFYYDPQEGE